MFSLTSIEFGGYINAGLDPVQLISRVSFSIKWISSTLGDISDGLCAKDTAIKLNEKYLMC